jgi:hypothetical protein
MTAHVAAVAFAHSPWSRGHVAPSSPNWLAVTVVVTSCVLMFVIATTVGRLRQPHRHRDDDDNDFRGGGGHGSGPDVPSGPQGEPAWWPQFERQFAAHVARSRPSTRA